ncbi:developmentally-regulated membrane protein [Acrasis kona]|uniref:Developmentally-regulated membrane protein n=1 Tax=Acrasis kona TaxID=1008807 RepID=A0AAW2ZFF2_9EUKA
MKLLLLVVAMLVACTTADYVIEEISTTITQQASTCKVNVEEKIVMTFTQKAYTEFYRPIEDHTNYQKASIDSSFTVSSPTVTILGSSHTQRNQQNDATLLYVRFSPAIGTHTFIFRYIILSPLLTSGDEDRIRWPYQFGTVTKSVITTFNFPFSNPGTFNVGGGGLSTQTPTSVTVTQTNISPNNKYLPVVSYNHALSPSGDCKQEKPSTILVIILCSVFGGLCVCLTIVGCICGIIRRSLFPWGGGGYHTIYHTSSYPSSGGYQSGGGFNSGFSGTSGVAN